MILFPMWVLRLLRACKKLSDFLFQQPVTNYREQEIERLYQHQAKAEAASNFIRKQIRTCKTLEQSYTIRRMIENLDLIHGKTIQVLAAKDSLSLALYNKQKDILRKL